MLIESIRTIQSTIIEMEDRYRYEVRVVNNTEEKEIIYKWMEIMKFHPRTNEKMIYNTNKDHFIFLVLPDLMTIGGIFFLEGKVSKSVLQNTQLLNEYWHSIMPDKYQMIQIVVSEEVDICPDKNNQNAVSLFSGGLDALYVALTQKESLRGHLNYKLKTSVLIQGNEHPINNNNKFTQIFEETQIVTNYLGIDLFWARLDVFDNPSVYTQFYICYFIAILYLFSNEGGYSSAFIGNDYSYSLFTLFKDAKFSAINCISDHLYASDTFKVFIDGNNTSRSQRASIVAKDSFLMKNLRVCSQDPISYGNCGQCHKCIRTILNFWVQEIKDIPCMPVNPLDEKFIISQAKKHMKTMNQFEISYYQDIFLEKTTDSIKIQKWYKQINKMVSKEVFLRKTILRKYSFKRLLKKIICKLKR